MRPCSSAATSGKPNKAAIRIPGGLALLLVLASSTPVQAGCQGDSLVGEIREGIEQAWQALAGGGSYRSVLCPEVMAAYAEPATATPVWPTATAEPATALPDHQGDADGDGVADARDWCQTTQAGLRVDERGCALMPAQEVPLPARQFEPGEDALKPRMQNALAELAGQLLATPGRERLRIVGHADSQGPDSYNDDLSLRRAWGVADFLSSKGVALSDISYLGKGESMPLANNRKKAGRAVNRRVEIVIY